MARALSSSLMCSNEIKTVVYASEAKGRASKLGCGPGQGSPEDRVLVSLWSSGG